MVSCTVSQSLSSSLLTVLFVWELVVLNVALIVEWYATGVELVLYIKTIQALLRPGTKHIRTNRFFMIFSTALLFLITIFVAVQAVFGQEMWIVNAGFEGGSAAYLAAYASVWYQTLGTTASIILQLMSDALLVSRVYPKA